MMATEDEADRRLENILDCLAEMERLVERLPECEREIGRAAVERVRQTVQPVIDALCRLN